MIAAVPTSVAIPLNRVELVHVVCQRCHAGEYLQVGGPVPERCVLCGQRWPLALGPLLRPEQSPGVELVVGLPRAELIEFADVR